MVLRHLRLAHLRNHRRSDIDCPAGIALFHGENGAGKTTVLEAVALLCTTRSFVTRQDRSMLTRGLDWFQVEGEFENASGGIHRVSLRHDAESGTRRIEVDSLPLESAADLIGRFPLVSLAPQHRPITAGGPAERRAFLDFLISQVHHGYLLDLMEYRRILRQRNALLAASAQRTDALAAALEPWDDTMAAAAARIIARRTTFLDEFLPYFSDAMHEVARGAERVDLRYSRAHPEEEGSDAAAIRAALGRALERDLRRGSTSVGPHRDEIEIRIDGLELRSQASQGQHKSVLIALKIAEYRYLDARLAEAPIILLDDVFSELDDDRLSRVLALLGDLGQTFITTASSGARAHFPAAESACRAFRVSQGSVLPEAVAA
jgi:DNA replication and repair protein RecF